MTIEIDNVELYFKSKPILNGIYLKAETGKVTAILGRNGSGKSCLMDIIFGDLKPKYSLIRLDKKPIHKPLFKIGNVKYLPQNHLILQSLKLDFVFQLFSVQWVDFIDVFPEFGKYQRTRFRNLSHGEKRIVEIYIVLNAKSEIVILDEPFNGLSPIAVEQIKHLISQEKKEKVILITDHRYDDVLDVADSIYLLHNGATKAINSKSQLSDYGYLN